MKYSQSMIQRVRTHEQVGDTINHQLLVQGGFVDQLMAGVFTYLPLGLRVLRNIENIVREEMNALGVPEIHMPALHPAEPWKTTGGWDSVDVLFKLESRTGREYALGQSHEEIITPLMQHYIAHVSDLPRAAFQIQWKFRDELRAKSGVMRGREFLMKDMYSLHATQEDFDCWYTKVKDTYVRIFARLGIDAKITEASGGNFSQKISYEFMVLTDAGEDRIRYCATCSYCVNLEIAEERQMCPQCDTVLKEGVASEIGNVFDLGDRYTQAFHATYIDASGEKQYPIMGCYGIGISRLMGVIVEKHHDKRGIVWPQSVAPFYATLVTLDGLYAESQDIYHMLFAKGIEVLWDDRDVSAGKKFYDADMIGNPYRIVVSKKSLAQGGVELRQRNSEDQNIMSVTELVTALRAKD